MPELPEVEIARRQLDRWTTGRTIARVILVDPTCVRRHVSSNPSDAWPEGADRVHALAGSRSDAPVRHGKRMGWPLGDTALLVHLGMTGSWVRRADIPAHARVGFELLDSSSLGLRPRSSFAGPASHTGTGGAAQARRARAAPPKGTATDAAIERVWLVDPRRFGCVVPIAADQLVGAIRDGLGPDALELLPPGDWRAAFARRGPIKPALLDQQRLAGLGNIHAIESLWRAGIAPTRSGLTITDPEWARLAEVVPAQLAEAIAAEDCDELVYTNLGGANPFAIYDREGEPCPRCEAPIERSVLGGRATYRCPGCQPA